MPYNMNGVTSSIPISLLVDIDRCMEDKQLSSGYWLLGTVWVAAVRTAELLQQQLRSKS